MTIGRKNWLFFGSEEGGKAMGTLMSIVQTCRRMKINVKEYLEDVLRRINGHSQSKLHELLPGNWTKAESYYN
jgi:transposase